MALKTAELRIEEAEDTGAQVIISACPFCSTNLQDGINSRGSHLKYYDISELLLMAMGLDPEKLAQILSEVD
jgi:Fe-S oxidoreductase